MSNSNGGVEFARKMRGRPKGSSALYGPLVSESGLYYVHIHTCTECGASIRFWSIFRKHPKRILLCFQCLYEELMACEEPSPSDCAVSGSTTTRPTPGYRR